MAFLLPWLIFHPLRQNLIDTSHSVMYTFPPTDRLKLSNRVSCLDSIQFDVEVLTDQHVGGFPTADRTTPPRRIVATVTRQDDDRVRPIGAGETASIPLAFEPFTSPVHAHHHRQSSP